MTISTETNNIDNDVQIYWTCALCGERLKAFYLSLQISGCGLAKQEKWARNVMYYHLQQVHKIADVETDMIRANLHLVAYRRNSLSSEERAALA